MTPPIFDLTGSVVHWIDVGQPDDRRLMKAHGRSGRVSVYSFASSTEVWWRNLENKLTRAPRLAAVRQAYNLARHVPAAAVDDATRREAEAERKAGRAE